MALQNTDHLLVQRSGSSYKMEASDIIPFLEAEGFGTSSVTVSATAPVGPTAGDMWWNSDDGNLYIYYQDADTTQWVPSNAEGGGFVNATVGANVPANASQGDLWYSTSDARLYIYDGAVWIDASPASAPNISTISDTAPSTPASGDLWYDLDSARLYVYNGSAWVDSAPGYGIQDGAVGTAQLADDAVTAAKIDSTALAKNIIINGAMQVAQRGTSNSSQNAANTYSTDRFLVAVGTSSAVVDHSQESSGGPEGFPYWLKVSPSTADTVIDATDYSTISQKVEGLNFAHVGYGTSEAKTLTVSFKFKTNKAGTYCMIHRNGAADRNYLHEFTPVADGNWQTITYTIPGDTTGTWQTDYGLGWRWELCLANGSSFQSSTVGSWFGGQYFHSSTNQVNFLDSTSNELGITAVQVTASAEPLPFQHEEYGTTIRKCYRYYQKLYFNSSAYENICTLIVPGASSANTGDGIVNWITELRTSPSVATSNGPTFRWNGGGLTDQVCSSVAIPRAGKYTCALSAIDSTSRTRASGNAGWLSRENTEDCWISADAEL